MALEPKRTVLAHVLICLGCCCGRIDRGRPEVPVEWLKAEWKRRGLLRHVQLTISGCLGPCDLANVVGVVDAEGMVYLGGLSTHLEYTALVEWAASCATARLVLPLPRLFAARQARWLESSSADSARREGAPS